MSRHAAKSLLAYSRTAIEAALTAEPEAARRIFVRTQLEGAPHKTVAEELRISMRQLYRRRAGVVNRVLARLASGDPACDAPVPLLMPAELRLACKRYAEAVERADADAIRAGTLALLERHETSETFGPVIEMHLATGDAVLARLGGSQVRAHASLAAAADGFRTLVQRGYTTASATMTARTIVAEAMHQIERGGVDSARRLLDEAASIASALGDVDTGVEITIAEAAIDLVLPGYAERAHDRAVACVRTATARARTVTLIRAIRLLGTTFAERGYGDRASAIRDIVASLAAVSLTRDQRLEHDVWAVELDVRFGSVARADRVAERLRRAAPASVQIWAGATLVRSAAALARGDALHADAFAADAERRAAGVGSRRLAGEAALLRAEIANSTGDAVAAVAHVARAIPLVYRAAGASVQKRAYALSSRVTGCVSHGRIAEAYTAVRPPASYGAAVLR